MDLKSSSLLCVDVDGLLRHGCQLRGGVSPASGEERGGVQEWRPFLHRQEVCCQPATSGHDGSLSERSDSEHQGAPRRPDSVHPEAGPQGHRPSGSTNGSPIRSSRF